MSEERKQEILSDLLDRIDKGLLTLEQIAARIMAREREFEVEDEQKLRRMIGGVSGPEDCD